MATIEILRAGLACSIEDLFMKVKPDFSTELRAPNPDRDESVQ